MTPTGAVGNLDAALAKQEPEPPQISDQPFDGMFGDTIAAKVLAEIVADPFHLYSPKDLVELVGASPPSVRTALDLLAGIGLLKVDRTSPNRPVYFAKVTSRRLAALTFLVMGSIDDRLGRDIDAFGNAIIDYVQRNPLLYARLAPVQNNYITYQVAQDRPQLATFEVTAGPDVVSRVAGSVPGV